MNKVKENQTNSFFDMDSRDVEEVTRASVLE